LTVAGTLVVSTARSFARFAGQLDDAINGAQLFPLFGLLRLFCLLGAFGAIDGIATENTAA
jgi:hypothetical protein